MLMNFKALIIDIITINLFSSKKNFFIDESTKIIDLTFPFVMAK